MTKPLESSRRYRRYRNTQGFGPDDAPPATECRQRMQAVAQPPRSGGVVDEYLVDHANEKRSLGQVFGCYGTLHILALTQVFKQPKATRASAVSRKPINRYNTPDRPRAAA